VTQIAEHVDRPARVDRRRAVLSGAVAAFGGLAAAELFGLVIPGRPSPVTFVADRVISTMPDGPREALIGAVGTLDKPLLVVGIVLAVIAGGAVIGRICAARQSLAPWLFAAGGVVGWLVAWNGSTADLLGLALVVAVGVTVASLAWMRLMPAPTPDTAGPTVSRRAVLQAAGFIGVAGVVALTVVTVARRGGSAAVDAVRTTLKIPTPTDPAAKLSAGITPDVPGIAPAITPAEDFYQIDVSLTPPVVDVATWSLTIDGRVDKPLTLSYNDLLAMPSIERYVTLTCVSNEVGGDLVGTAKWQGVRLTDLLAKVGVHDDATMVLGRSVDGFTVGFPRALLNDGRDAMLAYAMNGEPLPVKHGFPVRMVVPGLYGYVSATKWIEQVKLTTPEADIPFWFGRGWSDDGRIVAASRIDVPRNGTPVKAGRVAIGGRAWHQHTGVGSVEVSVDGGAWQAATLADAIGVDTWRLWSYTWDAVPGQHTLAVRMHDIDGTPQVADERPVFPGASTGLHTITVTAT
jgi:DMSO/TMAO reductase YedYZ molybdopterin-dependent catalytic subunit